MRLATRVGVFCTASLLACGSVSVAYATVDDIPPTDSASLSPGDESTPDSGPSMTCIPQIAKTDVTVQFQPTTDFDDLTVTAAGQSIAFEHSGNTAISVDRHDATEALLIELWDDNGQRADTCVVAAQPLPSPSPEEPEPSDPSPTESDEPTVQPQPTETESTSPTPTPTPPPSSSPAESPQPTPSDTQPPSEQSTPSTTEQSQQPPSPYTPSPPAPSGHEQQPEAPTSSPDQPVSRNIRPYSDSPRYLLPQFFGMNSHRGSPLIMPRPRDGEQPPTSFETLPPISEDELDAIKAQLSSPGRADHSTTTDELQSAEINDRLVSGNSWWLLAGITAVVCAGAGAWWVLSQRKRRH